MNRQRKELFRHFGFLIKKLWVFLQIDVCLGEMADWEAIADRSVSVEPLVSSQQEGESSSPSRVDRSPKGTPRRRGRGSFLYQKSCLYSDQFDEGTTNGGNPVAAEEVEVRDCRLEDADDQEWNCKHVFTFFVDVLREMKA